MVGLGLHFGHDDWITMDVGVCTMNCDGMSGSLVHYPVDQ